MSNIWETRSDEKIPVDVLERLYGDRQFEKVKPRRKLGQVIFSAFLLGGSIFVLAWYGAKMLGWAE